MITNKNINVLIVALVCMAVVFVFIYMLKPDLLGISAVESEPPAYQNALFNKNEIMTVDIVVDESAWQEMLDNAIDEEYLNCDIIINGTTYSSVGIRAKGNTSLTQVASTDSDRFSFKVEFDHFVSGQTCLGLDKLVLNNNYSDATYMKEYLSYDLLTYMGVVSPLYAYAEITVNGEPWGLYLALEAEEEAFADRIWGSDYGKLYKVESAIDGMGGEQRGKLSNRQAMNEEIPQLSDAAGAQPPNLLQEASDDQMRIAQDPKEKSAPEQNVDNSAGGPPMLPEGDLTSFESGGGADLVYVDDNISSYSDIFDNNIFKVSDADCARVIKAVKNLNQGTDLEQYVDVDQVLRYFAVNTVLVNLDSYVSAMKHNYYLYEEDGKISIVPWDYNLSFAGFQASGSEAAVNFPIDTPVSGVSLAERPLIGKLLEVDEYRQQYYQYLQQIITEYFNLETFADKVSSLDDLIGDYVANDVTAFYSYEEYAASLPALVTFADLRSQSVSGQLAGSIPSTSEGQATEPDKLIDASSLDLSLMGQMMGETGQLPNRNGREGPGQIEAPTSASTTTEQSGKLDEAGAEDQSTLSKKLIPSSNTADGDSQGQGDEIPLFAQSQMVDSSNWQLIVVSLIVLLVVLLIVWRWQRK